MTSEATTRVQGVVRAAGQTLRSKLHQTPCVYWDVRMGLVKEPEDREVCAFFVEDASGERFLVRAEKLAVDVRATRAEELVEVAEADIALVSAAIRDLKDAAKATQGPKQAEVNRERRRLAKVATLLCAIRADAKGNVHIGKTPAGQRAWIEKNTALAAGIGDRTVQRMVERFEVVLREGDAVEVEGLLRREPLPGDLGGGYRERTDCWALAPGPTGEVRVRGVGASAPVSEPELRGDDPSPALSAPITTRRLDPVLVATLLLSALALLLSWLLR